MCGMQKIARTLTSGFAWEHLALGKDITRAITTLEGLDTLECVRVAQD